MRWISVCVRWRILEREFTDMTCYTFIEALTGEDTECYCEMLLLVCTFVLDVVESRRGADGDFASFIA